MPIAVPTSRDAAVLADWAELLVLSTDGESVSVTRLTRLLKGEGSDEAEEELTLVERGDMATEEAEELELTLVDEGRGEREVRVEQLLDEIAVRLMIGPKTYPFAASDEQVSRRAAPGEAIYLFLLALSWRHAPARIARKLHEVEADYDELALEALKRYLGRGAAAHAGSASPRTRTTRATTLRVRSSSRRRSRGCASNSSLAPAARLLRTRSASGTGRTGVSPTSRGRVPLNSYEDGGVDVVVWWRFRDDRGGSPVLLAQCTVQLEWGEKGKDISVKRWEKWIDFATVPPQIALVVPFAVNVHGRPGMSAPSMPA